MPSWNKVIKVTDKLMKAQMSGQKAAQHITADTVQQLMKIRDGSFCTWHLELYKIKVRYKYTSYFSIMIKLKNCKIILLKRKKKLIKIESIWMAC